MVSVLPVQVFDEFLQQLGEDTAAYVRTVCQTIGLTVPKAVIHCMVSLPCLLSPAAALVCIVLMQVSSAG